MISEEEAKAIDERGRCQYCGHIMVLHDDELGDCQLCGCAGGSASSGEGNQPRELGERESGPGGAKGGHAGCASEYAVTWPWPYGWDGSAVGAG